MGTILSVIPLHTSLSRQTLLATSYPMPLSSHALRTPSFHLNCGLPLPLPLLPTLHFYPLLPTFTHFYPLLLTFTQFHHFYPLLPLLTPSHSYSLLLTPTHFFSLLLTPTHT